MTQLWAWKMASIGTLLGICSAAAGGQGENPVSAAQTSTVPASTETSSTASGNVAPAQLLCHGEPITAIEIHAYPPFETGGTNVTARIARLATKLHATTRSEVISRFLPIRVGDACEDRRLHEAERILRAQPFIADANLLVTPDGTGGVNIDVVTFDEVSLVLDGTITSKSPVIRSVRFGEENLSGAALSATGAWEKSRFYRDIYKARVVEYQLFGRPYQLSLQGTRNEIGGTWDALITHPFLTDLQRTSWRVSAGSSTGYRYFLRGQDPNAALPFTRAYADIGGVLAFGLVRHVFLVGATVSKERERTGRMPVLVLNTVVPDTSTALIGRYGEHRTNRVNLLLGFRNSSFLQVRAFDAVEGTQDMRTGMQLAMLFGRGFKMTPKDERDYFMSTDLYYGHGTPQSFAGIEFMGERRRNLDTHRFDGVLASGRAAWYAHPSAKHTSIFDVEYSGGSRQRVPFQLSLADRDGGMRGYGSSDLGGGQRVVMRLEDRYRLGHVRQFAGLAGAVWMDAGRLWAGDAPFGVNTNVKYAVGVGLLAALPPRSRRTWRVDFALPLNDRGDSKFEIRFTNHDFTRWFWHEPGDVQTSRERAIPNSVYNWP
ncbi:MAG TPA: hypothetical protein VN650_03160 [Gemmatimonadaceae bacterium]|nr:hypothetical protein [Gemmatimonadaceae bacterium]